MPFGTRATPFRLAIAIALALLWRAPAAQGDGGDLILAVSWQAAFCETRPNRPECRSQTPERFDATHFTLHGLWPQPRDAVYCGSTGSDRAELRSRRWSRLPPLSLRQETRRTLDRVMPGTRSFLHRHQWAKHGTCYSSTAEVYFRDSLSLLAELNSSSVRDLFAGNIGQTITAADLQDRASQAFGAAAGQRVTMHCRNDGTRRLIVELRLHLRGQVAESAGLGTLMAAAPIPRASCRSGIVDPVGLQ